MKSGIILKGIDKNIVIFFNFPMVTITISMHWLLNVHTLIIKIISFLISKLIWVNKSKNFIYDDNASNLNELKFSSQNKK